MLKTWVRFVIQFRNLRKENRSKIPAQWIHGSINVVHQSDCSKYRIRPTYRTERLGCIFFFKITGKTCGKICMFFFSEITGKTCSKICMYLLIEGTLYKRSAKDLFADVYAIFFMIFFIKTYVVGTNLNCLDLSRQFKWVSTTYHFIKK